MTEITEPTVCTVVVSATAGRCGAPAVFTLPGGKFAECAEHFGGEIKPARPDVFEPGTRVHVVHVGVEKTGTVVLATPRRVRVLVPVFVGTRRETTKVVTFDAEKVEVA